MSLIFIKIIWCDKKSKKENERERFRDDIIYYNF